MIMRTRIALACLLAVGCSLYANTAATQVVRESDTSTLAGVLYTPSEPVSWSMGSRGGEILFASLSADIYRAMSSHDHEEGVEAAEEPPSDHEGGGCSDESGGGPFKFYIKVLDPAGDVICSANRPAPPPGWQRDPRLACILPATRWTVLYTVEVGLKVNEEHEASEGTAEELVPYPFLLDLSLRRIAPNGALIQPAILESGNRL
jgi:hypothetical protein